MRTVKTMTRVREGQVEQMERRVCKLANRLHRVRRVERERANAGRSEDHIPYLLSAEAALEQAASALRGALRVIEIARSA